MRGVTQVNVMLNTLINISTHTPHARRDHRSSFGVCEPDTFQLTRLMRGVTTGYRGTAAIIRISTHTPHARRD